jgi:hypothetical protein
MGESDEKIRANRNISWEKDIFEKKVLRFLELPDMSRKMFSKTLKITKNRLLRRKTPTSEKNSWLQQKIKKKTTREYLLGFIIFRSRDCQNLRTGF